jgi:perosamine synthetase
MIKLIKPYISFDDVQADMSAIFDSGIFTRGIWADKLRNEICTYTSASFTHLATSATTALWVALKSYDIRPGDEVLVSDFSFPATANVVEDLGARPVFVDIHRDTFNMDAIDLQRKITSKSKAVIFVDALGNPSGIHDVKRICAERGLPLIEDAACALGSSSKSVRCGAIADITCFSFHPRKLICAGEGGAITCSDPERSAWLDTKLFHGASGMKDAGLDFVDYGYNFRLPEIQSMLACKQLARLGEVVADRQRIQAIYAKRLRELGFTAQKVDIDCSHNVQSIVFLVPQNVQRDELIIKLKAAGVESTIGTYAMSATTYYAKKYDSVQPNSLWVQNNTITLPCYDGLDVDLVTNAVAKILC